ncbi:MAG: hypothetical protein QCI82_10085, partial [Candidatus Thermoplasmatota archaeon]|nr:hypothetical protein [Candidatus Thermoplasmatota archaeon]
ILTVGLPNYAEKLNYRILLYDHDRTNHHDLIDISPAVNRENNTSEIDYWDTEKIKGRALEITYDLRKSTWYVMDGSKIVEGQDINGTGANLKYVTDDNSGMGFCSGNEDGDLTNRHSMDAAISYDIIPLDLNLWPYPITSNGEWNMSKKRWSNYLEEEYKYLPGDYDHDRLGSYSEFKYYKSKPDNKTSFYKNYIDGINVLIKHNIHDQVYTDEDPDKDGIPFEKEFKFFNFGANPFIKDIFVEVDWMAKTEPIIKYKWVYRPNGEKYPESYIDGFKTVEYKIKEDGQNKVIEAFSSHDIILHIDDGCMGGGKGNIPYSDMLYRNYEKKYPHYKYYYGMTETTYNKNTFTWHSDYFNDERHGIFHYAIICHYMDDDTCKGGSADMVWDLPQTSLNMWGYPWFYADEICLADQRIRDLGKDHSKAQASIFMHELGHNLGLKDHTGACMDYDKWQVVDYTPVQWIIVMEKIHRVGYINPDEINYNIPAYGG